MERLYEVDPQCHLSVFPVTTFFSPLQREQTDVVSYGKVLVGPYCEMQ